MAGKIISGDIADEPLDGSRTMGFHEPASGKPGFTVEELRRDMTRAWTWRVLIVFCIFFWGLLAWSFL